MHPYRCGSHFHIGHGTKTTKTTKKGRKATR